MMEMRTGYAAECENSFNPTKSNHKKAKQTNQLISDNNSRKRAISFDKVSNCHLEIEGS